MSKATQHPAPATSLTEVTSGRWALDPARTSITIRHTGYWGLMKIKGNFTPSSGEGEVLADGSARGTLTVDATTVNTKVALRDEHLRGKDFFNVAEHPSFIFTATHVLPQGRTSARVDGELTVRGTTRPLSFTAQAIEASPDVVALSAEIDIARRDFGMTRNPLGLMGETTTVSVIARFTRTAA